VTVCAQADREEVVERYLMGSLAPPARAAFEDHYFGCEECFAALQAQRALQAELAENAAQIRARPAPHPTPWRWSVALVTAVLVMVAVLGIRWGRRQGPSPPPPPAPAASVRPGPAGPSLAQLAHFDPPAYTPPVLRGAQDEATRKFRAAMKHYQERHYDLAIPGLRQAAKLDPEDAGTLFFLGVSQLLYGQTDDGIATLRQCVVLGDTPYLEEAHYYLAKAFLQKNDLAAAEAELQEVVRLQGALGDQARELLQAVQTQERSR
jgi:tetratricopeptide (TPR) repeat protein